MDDNRLPDEVKTWLFDILQSIEEIDSYFPENLKRFDAYLADTKARRAVERNLEIIGEAMNRVLKAEPQITLSNTKKIVATRNRIIHGYDAISNETIWGIVINHLPILKEEIKKLLLE